MRKPGRWRKRRDECTSSSLLISKLKSRIDEPAGSGTQWGAKALEAAAKEIRGRR